MVPGVGKNGSTSIAGKPARDCDIIGSIAIFGDAD